MDAQKARIKAMSEQFSIPIPNFALNSFDFPPLSAVSSPVGNAVTTTTNKAMIPQEMNKKSIFDERNVPSAPPAPRMPTALPVLGLWQPETKGSLPTAHTITSGLLSAGAPMPLRQAQAPLDQGPNPVTPAGFLSKQPQVTSITPKKDDLAYKTTPCKHFTLNRGWCPWGDECGL